MKIIEIVRGWRWPLVTLAGLGILFGLFAQTLPTFGFPKITNANVVMGFVSLVTVLAVVGLFFRRANLNKAKLKRPAPNVPPTPRTTEETNIDWTPWASSALIIVSFTLLFILIAIFFPALWEWLLGQGKVFWLLVVTILIVALAAKYKPVWWLAVIMGTVLLFSWTSFPPNPLDWQQSSLAKANQTTAERQIVAYGTSRSPAGSSAATSRVTTRTIMAKPGVYSDEISIPGGQNFNIQPEGKIRARTASGKIIDDWPGRHAKMEHGRSLLDGVFQFMSLEEREVVVVVEWEPK